MGELPTSEHGTSISRKSSVNFDLANERVPDVVRNSPGFKISSLCARNTSTVFSSLERANMAEFGLIFLNAFRFTISSSANG